MGLTSSTEAVAEADTACANPPCMPVDPWQQSIDDCLANFKSTATTDLARQVDRDLYEAHLRYGCTYSPPGKLRCKRGIKNASKFGLKLAKKVGKKTYGAAKKSKKVIEASVTVVSEVSGAAVEVAEVIDAVKRQTQVPAQDEDYEVQPDNQDNYGQNGIDPISAVAGVGGTALSAAGAAAGTVGLVGSGVAGTAVGGAGAAVSAVTPGGATAYQPGAIPEQPAPTNTNLPSGDKFQDNGNNNYVNPTIREGAEGEQPDDDTSSPVYLDEEGQDLQPLAPGNRQAAPEWDHDQQHHSHQPGYPALPEYVENPSRPFYADEDESDRKQQQQLAPANPPQAPYGNYQQQQHAPGYPPQTPLGYYPQAPHRLQGGYTRPYPYRHLPAAQYPVIDAYQQGPSTRFMIEVPKDAMCRGLTINIGSITAGENANVEVTVGGNNKGDTNC